MYIALNFPEKSQGNWSIRSFYEQDKKYQHLLFDEEVRMVNTPDIVQDFIPFLEKAVGHVLINGLGMGMCNVHLLQKPEIKSLTVIEKDEDLVSLIKPFFLHDSRCEIIHEDAFTYEFPKTMIYDFVWHDIWTYQSATNVKSIDTLFSKYEKHAKWQGAWREQQCRNQLKASLGIN